MLTKVEPAHAVRETKHASDRVNWVSGFEPCELTRVAGSNSSGKGIVPLIYLETLNSRLKWSCFDIFSNFSRNGIVATIKQLDWKFDWTLSKKSFRDGSNLQGPNLQGPTWKSRLIISTVSVNDKSCDVRRYVHFPR